MKAVGYKCPSCSASLYFDPKKQLWHCDYCGNDYENEQPEENEKKDKTAKPQETFEADVYSCSSCGAQIVADENTTATFCVYCKNTAIIKNRLSGLLKPSRIIPFKKSKEEAIQAFKKCKKGRLFAPKDFSDEKNINDITGVYIPFWLYDCDSEGQIAGEGENIKSWTSGSYRYTKVDTYAIERAGTMSFSKVPVDGSVKFDNDIMDSIEPFKYDEFDDFNMAYLSGFLSEKYDVEKEEAYKRAEERITNATYDVLENDSNMYTIKRITEKNINIAKKSDEYVLLPVWMLNIKYRNKMRKFAMNGQTGKLVGNIPISIGKLFAYWVAFFALSFAIVTAGYYLM